MVGICDKCARHKFISKTDFKMIVMKVILAVTVCSLFALISGGKCPKFDSLSVYRYKNVSSVNCGCDKKSGCLRKCCGPGYHLIRNFCKKDNSSDFVIPVHRGDVMVKNLTVTNYIAGVMNCSVYFLRKTEKETFYIQENFEIWTSPHNTVHVPDEFCVDYYVLGNNTGLGALVCFPQQMYKAVYNIGI